MTTQTVRIGIVGAGETTRGGQIPRFQAMDGVEIVAVCNRSRQSGRGVAEQFNIPRVYDSWVDVVADPDIDAVYIGTWPYMHHPVTVAALEHGKHVLTQARMAMNAREAREMLDASRRAPHLVTQVVPATSSMKLDATIKELMAEGYLGDVLSAVLTDSGRFIDRGASFTWRHDTEVSGYNALSLGYWSESMMRWLGPASSVTAITRVNVPTRYDGSGHPRTTTVPDHIEVIAEMASGPILHMRNSEVTGLGPPGQAWLFGSEGTLRLDLGPMTLFGGRKGDTGLSEIEIPLAKQGRWRVEEEFVNAIRGLEEVKLTTFEDGVRYMEFTDAVATSAKTRRTVYLPS